MAIHLTLPYNLAPKIIYNHVEGGVSFCIFIVLVSHWLCIHNLVEFGKWPRFSFFEPPPLLPPHFGLVFAYLDFWGPTDYVYKIWLSLVNGQDFHFLTPPPHFARLVFAFLDFWGPTNYVYKIWLSLLKRPRFFIFNPPPPPLILGRYAPKSNQLLISMEQSYMWNLVSIFTLVFELARPQKFGNAQTN